MEFVTQAESHLLRLKSLLFRTVKIGPLADVIVGYVTTLDLEFERNVLIAGCVDSKQTYTKVLKDSFLPESKIIRKYVEMVQCHTASRRFYHQVLDIDETAMTECHRAGCYYPAYNPRTCTCGSPMVPIDYVKYY